MVERFARTKAGHLARTFFFRSLVVVGMMRRVMRCAKRAGGRSGWIVRQRRHGGSLASRGVVRVAAGRRSRTCVARQRRTMRWIGWWRSVSVGCAFAFVGVGVLCFERRVCQRNVFHGPSIRIVRIVVHVSGRQRTVSRRTARWVSVRRRRRWRQRLRGHGMMRRSRGHVDRRTMRPIVGHIDGCTRTFTVHHIDRYRSRARRRWPRLILCGTRSLDAHREASGRRQFAWAHRLWMALHRSQSIGTTYKVETTSEIVSLLLGMTSTLRRPFEFVTELFEIDIRLRGVGVRFAIVTICHASLDERTHKWTHHIFEVGTFQEMLAQRCGDKRGLSAEIVHPRSRIKIPARVWTLKLRRVGSFGTRVIRHIRMTDHGWVRRVGERVGSRHGGREAKSSISLVEIVYVRPKRCEASRSVNSG